MKFIQLTVLFILSILFLSCTSGAVRKEQERDARNAALLARSVESTDQDFVNGKKLLQEEKFDEALAAFEKSSYSKAVFFRAVILQNKGDAAKAEELFKECAQKGVLKAESFYNLGLIAFDRGDKPVAEQMMKNALKADPEHIPSLYFIGNLHFIEMELDKAMEYYKKGLKADPRKTELWDAVFTVYLQKGEWEECWKLRGKVGLSNPLILSNLLKIGQMLGHYGEAVELVPENMKNDLSVRQEMRIVLTRSGRIKDAVKMAKEDMEKADGLDYAIVDRGGSLENSYLLIQRNDGEIYLLCSKDRGKETPVSFNGDTVSINGLSEKVSLPEISGFCEKVCKN
jgi:tetratricopeptide (TPR) repeat protein